MKEKLSYETVLRAINFIDKEDIPEDSFLVYLPNYEQLGLPEFYWTGEEESEINYPIIVSSETLKECLLIFNKDETLASYIQMRGQK